jgi:predicted nucleotidyltransferase
VRLGADFLAAAVFGSWARGDADENSDIDLLVIA